MTELLASKTVITEAAPQTPTIRRGPTAILACLGVTERGPLGEPTLVQSFAEYRKRFGGYITTSDATEAMEGYFGNGGQQAWVVRTVHYTDPGTPATKTSVAGTRTLSTEALAATAGSQTGTGTAPFVLVDGDDLICKIDGGADDPATFNAAATSEDAGAGPFNLTDGWTLTLKVNQGAVQTVIFNTAEFANIAAATRGEVAAVINAEATGIQATDTGAVLRITTDRKGTGAYLEITGGTANGALGFGTAETQGTGDAVDSDAVTIAELKTLIEGDVANISVADDGTGKVVLTSTLSLGAGSSVQVTAPSSMDAKLGFDNAVHSGSAAATLSTLKVDGKTDGSYSDNVKVEIKAPTSGVTGEFNLEVQVSGVVLETWPNLSMDDSATRYVETIVNNDDVGSDYIAVTDLDAATTAVLQKPAVGLSAALAGGDDGLTGLVDADFLGADASPLGTGLRAFDGIEASILIVPGRATSGVQNGMITYGETTRGKARAMFSVLDPPASQNKTQIAAYVETTAALKNVSEFAAFYWPRIKIVNPSTTVFGKGDTITIPPSGHIAGVFARVDGSKNGGVYLPPAGNERSQLKGAIGLETDEVEKEAVRDFIYPKLINSIARQKRGTPVHLEGVRTLKETGNFPTIAERRGVMGIEAAIEAGIDFARFSNHDEELRARCDRTVNAFLLGEMGLGAFKSKVASEAFFVDFGDGLNTPQVVLARQLKGRIGLATQTPAEFVVLEFSKDTRAIDAQIEAAKG